MRCWCGHYEESHSVLGHCTARPHDVPSCTCKQFKAIAVEQLESEPAGDPEGIGYHLTEIPKGQLGEVSKIEEEFLEFKDAIQQRASVMQLCELADMIGAIRDWLSQYHPSIGLSDLIKMADITERAFKNGRRK